MMESQLEWHCARTKMDPSILEERRQLNALWRRFLFHPCCAVSAGFLLGQNPKCSSEAASSQTQICSVSSTAHLINKKINQQQKEKSQKIFEVLNGSCSESLFILMSFLCGLGRTTSQPQLPAVTQYKYRQSGEGAGCESRRQRMPKETNPQNGTRHRQETGALNLSKYGMAMAAIWERSSFSGKALGGV